MAPPGLATEVVAQIQGKLLNGEKPINIAEDLGVSYSSVMRAKAKIPSDVLEKMDSEQVGVISDLIMLQLETGVEGSIAIAAQIQDAEWRDRQTAAHLATLYGVITDKSIRLLEASENASRTKAAIDDAGLQDYSN